MNRALSACALFFLKRALFKAHKSIVEKLRAFRTELASGFVLLSAIVSYHSVNGFFLSFDSWMLCVRLRQFGDLPLNERACGFK